MADDQGERGSRGRSGSGDPPRVDVYARLSKAVDGETIKVDDQVELCTEKIAARGGVVGEVFKDNSLSAWNPKVVRPEWNELMRRLEAGQSDGVMVYDLTRFSRKVMEGERLVELAARGVRVWALSGEYDLATADGRRHFRESMVAAAGESDKISERVKRGKVRRARKGRHHGGGRAFGLPGLLAPGPGWEPGDLREAAPAEQVAAEQAVIRECYDRLFAGDSVTGVVRDLNARGVVSVNGNPWHRASLSRMLCRATLAGLVVHGGEVVTELVNAEPVVSREEWERMCSLFAARKRGRPPSPVHLLSGLMRCAQCGTTLVGAPRRQLPPYPDGSFKREYRCRRTNDPNRAGCGANHIDGLTADHIVAVAVKARLGDPRRAQRIAARLAQVREQRASIEADIARWDEAADELAAKTAAWGVARVDKAMAPILREITKLRERLAGLDEPEDHQLAAADAARAWDQAAQRHDFGVLRAMIRRALPNLTLNMPARWGDHSADRFDFDGPH